MVHMNFFSDIFSMLFKQFEVFHMTKLCKIFGSTFSVMIIKLVAITHVFIHKCGKLEQNLSFSTPYIRLWLSTPYSNFLETEEICLCRSLEEKLSQKFRVHIWSCETRKSIFPSQRFFLKVFQAGVECLNLFPNLNFSTFRHRLLLGHQTSAMKFRYYFNQRTVFYYPRIYVKLWIRLKNQQKLLVVERL